MLLSSFSNPAAPTTPTGNHGFTFTPAPVAAPPAVPTGNPNEAAAPVPGRRKRLKPGERRVQILQTLANMLEQPGSERVTTAHLAARLQVSEAALYRHFASKTQMFEALLELVELAFDNLIGEANQTPGNGREHAEQLIARLLSFAETNPGLARVISGDALMFEHERLQKRLSALLEQRLEGTLRQYLQEAGAADPAIGAELLSTFALGRIHVWSRSGFSRKPTADLTTCLARILG